MLLDAHCHLDRLKNPAAAAARCERLQITTVAVTELPSYYLMALPHVRNLKYVKLALGFHPLAIGRTENELTKFLKLLPSTQFVGEIGLDFSKVGIKTRVDQLAAFEKIIGALDSQPRFVSLHSVNAVDAVLDVLTRHNRYRTVFHWFTGSLESLQQALDLDCRFSINPAMLRSAKGRGLIEHIPQNCVLTETDAPHVSVEGRGAVPSDVNVVIEFLSRLWNVSTDQAEKIVFSNFSRVLQGK